MTHSPEPWKIESYWIESADEDVVASVDDGGTVPNSDNARRIVACVNVCRGISIEVLESLSVRQVEQFRVTAEKANAIADGFLKAIVAGWRGRIEASTTKDAIYGNPTVRPEESEEDRS